MRTILVLLILALTGCAFQPICPGHRYYDPQVCRGEKTQRLANFPYEALQREQKCKAGIQPDINCVWGR